MNLDDLTSKLSTMNRNKFKISKLNKCGADWDKNSHIIRYFYLIV